MISDNDLLNDDNGDETELFKDEEETFNIFGDKSVKMEYYTSNSQYGQFKLIEPEEEKKNIKSTKNSIWETSNSAYGGFIKQAVNENIKSTKKSIKSNKDITPKISRLEEEEEKRLEKEDELYTQIEKDGINKLTREQIFFLMQYQHVPEYYKFVSKFAALSKEGKKYLVEHPEVLNEKISKMKDTDLEQLIKDKTDKIDQNKTTKQKKFSFTKEQQEQLEEYLCAYFQQLLVRRKTKKNDDITPKIGSLEERLEEEKRKEIEKIYADFEKEEKKRLGEEKKQIKKNKKKKRK